MTNMTRKKILDAALSLYADYGYKGTTMKKIADTVGIKAASIYFFFPNKEQLLLGVFHDILENHKNEIRRNFETTTGLSLEESLQKLITGIARYHRDDLISTKAYIQLITSDMEEFKSKFSEYTVSFEEWLLDNYLESIQTAFPKASLEAINRCILQIEVVANGLFWSTVVYSDEAFEQQIIAAQQLIIALLQQLKMEG